MTASGTLLAPARRMHALDVRGELLDDDTLSSRERPTIPVPRDSGVCLKVTQIPLTGATVDAVVCDLSRDPRSEDYAPDRVVNVSPLRRRGRRARRLFA